MPSLASGRIRSCSYPKIKALLAKLSDLNLSNNEDFISAITSFEYHLIRTIMDKTHKVTETAVSILGDAFTIMTNISKELLISLENKPSTSCFSWRSAPAYD